MKVHYQGIKRYAFCDAQESRIGSLYGAEKWMRELLQRAGRPCSGENRESSNSGGHRDEEIKIRPAVESCWHLGDKPMRYIALTKDKLCGIDNGIKINSMLCQEGVA